MNIYDIAKLTGVSASTVSRVVNGKPGVGKEKRALIEEALRIYNYTPDENARSLVTQSSHLIGILTDNIGSRRQNEGIARIEKEILNGGYYCFTRYTGTGKNAIAEGVEDMARRKVEGLLVLGATFRDHAQLQAALERYLPETPVMLVNQSKRFDMDTVYCVGADEGKGFRRCIDRLVKRGRRRIALMVDEGRVSEKNIVGYFQDTVSRFPEVTGTVCRGVEPTVEGGTARMRELLCEHPDIDAVLCAQDGIAVGAMYECIDSGRKVPEDVSVIGEDNSVICGACRPKLTSLDTMLTTITELSARILIDILNGNERGHSVTLDMELCERESV